MTTAGAYHYYIFTAAINVYLDNQESEQNVCYQSPHILTPDDYYAEVPIALRNDREKINENNLNYLVGMMPEKPLDPKHIIAFDQELL